MIMTKAVTRGKFGTVLWCCALLCMSTALGAQQKIELRRAAASDMSLRIQGAFSSLRVIGWTKDSVVVIGVLPKGFRIEGGIGGSDGTPARGGKLFVEGPESLGPSGGTLEVYVPTNATVWAKAFNATIDVAGITGSLDLNIVSGSVHVAGSPRELSVASMDGAVVVTGSPDWTRLKTADGDIVMRGGSTDAAFTTVSGMIRVGEGALERARFETVTGGIEFTGDFARGAVFQIDSHSGAVDLRLPRKAALTIDAATITGSIENLFTAQRPTVGRDGRGATFATSTGQDNGRLVVRTFKGNIRLTSR